MEIESLLRTYKKKKVLITGHTGFKGSWLSTWLYSLGADVIGLALDPKHENDNFVLSGIGNKIKDYRGDIRDKKLISEIFEKEKPEFVFHLAAQPLVIESYNNPLYTYEVNTLGTANVLEVMRFAKEPMIGIFITTDKVYENREWVWPYRETDRLGGYDPYSASKASAELIISSYRNAFFNTEKFAENNKSIASVRAGNVIGGGDWTTNRIVPDFIRSIENNEILEIRNPKAVRPWQYVLEPLGGYLLLGVKILENPKQFSGAWNFGPENTNMVNVSRLVEKLIEKSKKGKWVDRSNTDAVHEAKLLSLDINKAKSRLKWRPILSFDETIKFTIDWYMNYRSQDVFQLCLKQIKDYTYLWRSRSKN